MAERPTRKLTCLQGTRQESCHGMRVELNPSFTIEEIVRTVDFSVASNKHGANSEKIAHRISEGVRGSVDKCNCASLNLNRMPTIV
jgi:hypothetical protein